MKKRQVDKTLLKQIKKDFKNDVTIRLAPGSLTQFDKLKISADYYGYDLVKREDGYDFDPCLDFQFQDETQPN